MSRAARRAVAPLLCAAALCGAAFAPAHAQTANGLFSRPPEGDVASAWLDLLFRGTKLPENIAYDAPSFGAVADALHRALALYSTSILLVGGLLLFYNIILLVIETAHYGTPFGRRSAQVWAPIRLVLAIAFLVPVSGSLNSGQYLVAWMTQQGSALASNVWNIAANSMKGGFTGIAQPHSPNVVNFVAGGLEMELCRGVYRRIFADQLETKTVQLAGNIDGIQKVARTRFAEETWQYTNRLHSNLPLCGAYRFASSKMQEAAPQHMVGPEGVINRLSNDIATFSRAETDKLISEAQALAENNVPVFLGDTPGPGIHDVVATMVAAHQASVNERIRALMSDDAGLIDGTLADSSNAGWILAGGFMLQLSRLQEIYGTLASHALPSVQAPVLDEIAYMRTPIENTISSDSVLWSYPDEELRPLKSFYLQLERVAHRVHLWLYDRQLADMPMVLANPFNMRDQLNAASDPEAVSSLFSHVLNDAAISYGVWNNPNSSATLGSDQPLLALPAAVQNAIAALAEFGRRQISLGNYLFGIASPDIAPSGTLAYMLLLGVTGFAIMCSGFALVFLIPLLPFFRFFVGILSWLLSVFEAIIAVPLVALAHLNFSGEGLSGGAAKQAYLLWLNIIIRPVLTLFGLITGLLLFTLAIIFLGMIFYPLARLAPPAAADMFVTINVVLTLLYTVLACAAANVSFKGITLLPEMAFKWLGNLSLPTPPDVMPVSINNNPALPGFSVTSSFLSPTSTPLNLGSQKANSPAVGTNRPHGLKLALFPNYRDEIKEKDIGQAQLTHLQSSTDSQARNNNNDKNSDPNVRVTQNTIVKNHAQKQEKARSENSRGLGGHSEPFKKNPREDDDKKNKMRDEEETEQKPKEDPDAQ